MFDEETEKLREELVTLFSTKENTGTRVVLKKVMKEQALLTVVSFKPDEKRISVVCTVALLKEDKGYYLFTRVFQYHLGQLLVPETDDVIDAAAIRILRDKYEDYLIVGIKEDTEVTDGCVFVRYSDEHYLKHLVTDVLLDSIGKEVEAKLYYTGVALTNEYLILKEM